MALTSVERRRAGTVTAGLARRALRAMLRASGMYRDAAAPAALLLTLAVFIALMTGASEVERTPAVPSGPAVIPGRAVGATYLLPSPPRRRRGAIKPSWTGLLLAVSCLLSGDVEPNPGPGRTGGSITVMFQNVQSVKNKLGDLRQSAAELQKFSIVTMAETWLTGAIESAELESVLPSHTLLRRDRVNRAGGGVACFVSNSLSPERREALEPSDAEMLVVEARTAPPLLLAVCYCPPDNSAALVATMAGLCQLVAASPGKTVVAVGDFNVPDVAWTASAGGGAVPVVARRSRRSAELLDGCHLAGLQQHVTAPSRGVNYLDLVLSNSQNLSATVQEGVFPSDHKEVVCDVRAVRGPVPVVNRSTALNYKRADWTGLRAVLRLTPWNVLDGLPVNDATALFYDLLNAAITDHIPLVQLRGRQPPWFDGEIRAALKEKEAAHRRLKKSRTPVTETLFRDKRRLFKRLARRKFYQYLKGLTDDLKTNPKRFWSYLKCAKGKHTELPYLIDGDVRVTDDREKSEVLSRSFAAKFCDEVVLEMPSAPDYDLDPLRSFHVSTECVREILSSVDRHKACGPDNISGRIIRECADELAVPVTKLCNLSFRQSVVPDVWKRANIVPIHKKGSRNSPVNYRSVSLMPIFSKVIERVVFTSLFKHVRPVLSNKQHGFMPGRSCTSNLCTLLHEAWSNISAGSQTDVIYTDYSSAFQSVSHKLLLHKLQNSFQISYKAIYWLKSYLSDRKQRVVVKGKCSRWTDVRSGTPEGGILSPLLFVCFINDLPLTLQTNSLMFADDVKLFCRVDGDNDVGHLQLQLDQLCRWSRAWGLSLNPSKCKVLSLSLRRKPIVGEYTVGGVVLDRVSVMRDLGVLLDEKLTFGDHVDATVRKANRMLGLLTRTFQTGKRGRSLQDCDIKSVICSYYANVRSILEYCSVAWNGVADTHVQRIERVQHKFLMWLRIRFGAIDVSLDYNDLLRAFKVETLAARRMQHDILFIRNVHRHVIDSSFLLEHLPLTAPTRLFRSSSVFHVPFGRTNTVRNGTFGRVPRFCNDFLDKNRDVDVWTDSHMRFRKRLTEHVRACNYRP